jgi:hypothetical protein
MKHILLTICTLLLFLAVEGQPANLVIFAANNDPFTVIMDGFRVNDVPAGNIKISGLNTKQYDVQIQFNNPNLGLVREQVFVQPGRELTLALVRQQNGLMDLIFVNEFSLTVGLVPPMNQQQINYTGTPTVFNPPPRPVIVPAPTPTPAPVPVIVPAPAPVPPNPLPGYNGPIGCDWPMEAGPFEDAKASISAKSFSTARMTIAKQITGSNCLLVSQVREIMDLFTFEADKLEYVKFAYDYTYDRGNFYRVNDGFGFSSSTTELDKFLQGK